MNTQLENAVWLNDVDVCSIDTLAAASGLSLSELHDLMEAGVLLPVRPAQSPVLFHLHHVVTVRTARRLRDDFELDGRGLALALVLLQRIRALEQELRE
jgi:chaperone modulatory protein CbpM